MEILLAMLALLGFWAGLVAICATAAWFVAGDRA